MSKRVKFKYYRADSIGSFIGRTLFLKPVTVNKLTLENNVCEVIRHAIN